MKRKRFSVEQITAVLQQAAQGVPVGDLCRKIGISEQSFYRFSRVLPVTTGPCLKPCRSADQRGDSPERDHRPLMA